MISLLAKIFISNPKDYTNPDVRKKYGMLAGILGIVLNIILSIAKFVAGVLSGAISIMADAFNNLSDAGASIVSLAGFCLGDKIAKLGVGGGLGTAVTNCDGNFLTDLCKYLRFSSVGFFFLVFDVTPFAVS